MRQCADKNAIKAARNEVVQIVVDILRAGADIDKIPFRAGGRLKMLYNLAVIWVADVFQHKSDLHGLARGKTPGNHVRLIIELCHGSLNALYRFAAHFLRIIHYVGNRCRRYACQLCNILTGRFHEQSTPLSAKFQEFFGIYYRTIVAPSSRSDCTIEAA